MQTAAANNLIGPISNFSTDNVVIGARSDLPAWSFFNGTIDEVRIYNYSMTADEINASANPNLRVNKDIHFSYSQPSNTTPFLRLGDFSQPVTLYRNNSATAISKSDDLVLWFKFNNLSSNGVYENDSSGYGNNGTLVNMNFTGNSTSGWNSSGRFGSALVFDGVNDYINTGTGVSSTLTSAATVEAWIYANTIPSASDYDEVIDNRRSADDMGVQLELNGDNQKFKFIVDVGASTALATSDNTFSAGRWYHIIGTWDGTTVKIYVDGVLQATTGSISGTITHTDKALMIGSTSAAWWFNGTIDNVKIYKRALSADEVAAEYRATQEDHAEHALLGAGEYNFTAYYPGSQNYTPYSLMNVFDVEKVTPILAIAQNNTYQTGGGLVGYWSFDENASGVAYDSSGKGNDGTLNMPTSVSATSGRNTTNCKYGNCLVFDGTDDYVDIPNSAVLNITNGLTIETWIKSAGGGGNYPRIISRSDGSTQGYEIVNNDDNSVSFYLYNGSTSFASNRAYYTANGWTHIAVTFSRPSGKLFVNGALSQTVTMDFPIDNYINDLRVGKGYAGGGGSLPFNGLIDEVRIYNYSMSQAEIQASMNATIYDLPITYANATNVTGYMRLGDASANLYLTRNYSSGTATVATKEGSDLVGYWKMNEGAGNYTNDTSSYGNNGTLSAGMNPTGNATSGWNATDCRFGACLKFDGVNDEVDTSSITFSGSAMSFSFWFKTSGRGIQEILGWTQNRMCSITNMLQDKLTCTVDADGAGAITSSRSVDDGRWHHIVYTSTSNAQTMYIDGTYENGASETLDTTSGALIVGTRAFGSTHFNGLIDEVRIYNRVLTASEILQLYQAGSRGAVIKQ